MSTFKRTAFKTLRLVILASICLVNKVHAQAPWPVDGYHGGMAAPSPVQLANPLQGTDSTGSFSHGNTYPAIALPFPMNTWAPYTQPVADSFFYQYNQKKLRGIRQTHQASVWVRDYAAFSLMPVSGKLAVTEDERASDFRHEEEIAQPSYYRALMDTWNVVTELTPTERCARFRFTFQNPSDSYIVLDSFPGDASVEVIAAENKIVGFTRFATGRVPRGFANYFVIAFDRPFVSHGVWTPDNKIQQGVSRLAGKQAGAYVQFDTIKDRKVECRVGSSYISIEQAQRNIDREIGKADFDTVRQQAEQCWNSALGRVKIEGGTEEQHRTFYSALYRSVLFPNRFHEPNEQGKPVYYSPYDGKIHSGVMYTDSGYWDTFRAAHPLYNLLFPEISAEILQSMISAYDQSGWLPAWSCPGQFQCMIGNHAFSLLADGWVKGVRDFDVQKAVTAMVHDAHNPGPIGTGRSGVKTYDRLGYVAFGDSSDSTAKTLEYAYDDFCAGVLARAAGRNSEADAFMKSAMNYINVFDPATKFARGRKADGTWCEPFDPIEWGGAFVEGNAWQWTWSVMHDVPGLINLMGGDKAFTDKLDTMLSMGSAVNTGTYRTMIHEMREMVAQNMGQYAHCNEPCHHILYLYDYAGQPWKTQARVRQVMNMLYQSTPDGLSGDEDTGQTSAWYVLSALGIYPVCPGDPNYAIGSPLFKKATISLPHGLKFTIAAPNNGPQRPYIHAAVLNGQPWNKVYLSHDQIAKGGQIVFDMTSVPDYQWGVGAESRPPASMPRHD
ncbi:MAG: GH92 family glycosyl hydrolase [Bacillota bacterium]